MASAGFDVRPVEDPDVDSQVSSPRIHINSQPLSTDSMTSVSVPEPEMTSRHADDAETASVRSDSTIQPQFEFNRVDSLDIVNGTFEKDDQQTIDHWADNVPTSSGREEFDSSSAIEEEDLFDETEGGPQRTRSDSSGSSKSHDSGTVDWVELERTEEEEARDEVSDESTAFLLARLEQENNALAIDPRFGLKSRPRKQSRPPSIQVLKRLVRNPSIRSSRYSVLHNPPPMTELEFWAALVKDYPQTAQRLPTLTSNKIKSGVPPPLRGVVWMSMVGARDSDLADQFDKLVQESSPYENLIGKDIGRSFPGVEMFRDADGEGQQMLARVLKSFSLYDKEIGYCQGLGFLVGPLLMQMGDKDAFCVLVRLMENYDLRSCFLPDLAGLHLRIFQFQRLLDQHMPTLAAHLASLQVEAAYLSQWFLSFFAVTCPLSMLFRIYDVIFAEGASETIMRVALSLMRRNEQKIMESHEFEEVMQLLLSRTLWETYAGNADDLVNDFVEMTGIVTRESLKSLEMSFRSAPAGETGAWFGFVPDATAAASRFLGRLWTPNNAKSGGLTPGQPGASRPGSFLRRSPSKQSIATSINSTDVSSEGANSVGTVTTDATTVMSRDSSGDKLSRTSKSESLMGPTTGAVSKEDKDLHGQIEDLLMALGDMQRQHALLTSELQKEREERSEDHQAFEELVQRLRPEEGVEEVNERRRTMQHPLILTEKSAASLDERRQTMPSSHSVNPLSSSTSPEIDDVLDRVDQRLNTYRAIRQTQILETKQRLRESLIRSKDQLQMETSRSIALSRQLDEQEHETNQVREHLRDTQARLQDEMREKQKLEKALQEMKISNNRNGSRNGSVSWSDTELPPALWRTDTSDRRMSISSFNGRQSVSGSAGGLRELRLGRPDSLIGGQNKSLLSPGGGVPKRTSSLATQAILSTEDHVPATEDDLLVELVAAKTSEAEARQELEEVKSKLDALRRMLDIPASHHNLPVPAGSSHKSSPSESTVLGSSTVASFLTPKRPTTPTPPAGGGGSGGGFAGGFFGWGKRSMSSSSPAGPAQAQAQAGVQEGERS